MLPVVNQVTQCTDKFYLLVINVSESETGKKETAVPEIDGHSCDEVDGRTGEEEREIERNKELKTIAD